ncbi:hypothetical protein N781_16155 [Pontibacillus halophilus JSM 076056 = DSM 19796]|uniref:SHOCT domain-containing protein n=1 Tax=Pontibacillus halophilus JSM 076056 = DSM 19796 TaxID=1385510 RepID=A0A0A5GMU3_9BACI|nr:SHOCT domain-containing protein [Pontibacillus halophilus]KGX92475.1 hypothetical protein N781_16155 [Pontibacillus halophilus JSM 076056 = DSM 19796]
MERMMNTMMHDNGMGGWFFNFGFLGLLSIVIILVLGVMLVKASKNHKNSETDSIETLKHRLAKGELTEEEYDRLKEKLSRS